MFDSFYPYKSLGKVTSIANKHLIRTYKYFFDTEDNVRYIINVEEYPENIFVLKFHPRSLKDHQYKYNILNKTGHLSKIIRTNIEVLRYFYKNFPECHFGFIGARTYCPIKKELTEDKPFTKRFILYKYAVINLIDSETFEHHEDTENSTYLLINTKTKDIDKIKSSATKMFEDCID